MEPLISVIVPVFNQGQFLSDALASVYNQTYSNWECLIINDGSTDNSDAVAKKWCSRDERFHYYHKKNGGLSSARNFGLRRSKGEFIQFLDADDFIDSSKFEICLESISATPKENLDIAVTDFLMYFDKVKQYQPPYCKLEQEVITYETILFQWDEAFSIPIHCAFFDVRLFDSFQFHESLKAKEDWIMWILLFKNKPDVVYIDKPLAFYRKHEKSMTMSEGIFEEHMKSLAFLKENIDSWEYEQLLEVMVKRYYRESLRFKTELFKVKRSNLYRLNTYLSKVSKKLKMKFL